jgi:hypothetical protein
LPIFALAFVTACGPRPVLNDSPAITQYTNQQELLEAK